MGEYLNFRVGEEEMGRGEILCGNQIEKMYNYEENIDCDFDFVYFDGSFWAEFDIIGDIGS